MDTSHRVAGYMAADDIYDLGGNVGKHDYDKNMGKTELYLRKTNPAGSNDSTNGTIKKHGNT